jgi:hypothetical protein
VAANRASSPAVADTSSASEVPPSAANATTSEAR